MGVQGKVQQTERPQDREAGEKRPEGTGVGERMRDRDRKSQETERG